MNMSQHSTDILLLLSGAVIVAAVVAGRSLSVKIGNIHAELKPNGGKSTRDAIERIEQHLKVVDARLDGLVVAPVLPVLPVAPVAPVLPVAPIETPKRAARRRTD